jgi:dipeptidyl aminopeptidase/acylaminoacyl peptidase
VTTVLLGKPASMIHRIRCLPLLLLLCHQPALATTPADMNRQIATTRAVTDVALSPDGKSVASVITDPTTAGGHSHVWLLSRNGAPRQITGIGTDSAVEDSSPAWTPDGSALLYLAKADQSSAVKRVDVRSGRSETLVLARQGSAVAGGWGATPAGRPVIAQGYAVAPTGNLVVWAADGSDAAERAARKEDQHVYGQSEPVRLYLLGDQMPREIALPDNVQSVAWNEDGQKLLVVTAPASDDLGEQNRVWLIEGDKAPREIRGTAENVQSLSWLPDGRIAYVARCRDIAPTVCHDLFVQALDGSQPHDLTEGIDGSLLNSADNYARVGPIIMPSGEILVTIARHFEQQVALIRPSDGRLTWINTLQAVVKAVGTNAAHSRFALLAAERGGIDSVQIADTNLRRYAPVAVPTLQPADWKPLHGLRLQWTSDGYAIDGMLYLPDGTTAARPVPLIVHAHGGPAGRFEDVDYPLVRLLLAEGWGVLQVNPRGSFGYGTKFLAALRDDLGGGDYRDIMAGLPRPQSTRRSWPSWVSLMGERWRASCWADQIALRRL